jgi:hypothetical protein
MPTIHTDDEFIKELSDYVWRLDGPYDLIRYDENGDPYTISLDNTPYMERKLIIALATLTTKKDAAK